MLRPMKKAILFLTALSFSASATADGLTVNGIAYGEPATITGLWVSNYENSRFLECPDGSDTPCDSAHADRPLDQWASVSCADRHCSMLDEPARALTGAGISEPPQGSFRIRFIGRHGLTPHKPRHIRDGSLDIWVDRVLNMERLPDAD